MTIDFMQEAQALREEVVALRRDFHRHPELGFEEVRTAGIVAEQLEALGLEVQRGVGKTGVVAILEGSQDGATVLVRADMDALPIQEANDTEYASTVAGKMHACGHDGHTAIALGVAKLLTRHRDQLKGRVKFVFQPAEEIGRGAQAMVDDGVLTNPRPDVALGLHLWNAMPVGQLGVADGAVMAGCADIHIRITGKGGHGAVPHAAVDPIVCAAQVIMSLQTVVSRNVDPIKTAVISMTTIHGGTATNVIPEEVTLSGTMRFFSEDVARLMDERIRTIVRAQAEAMGCKGEVTIAYLTEPVMNNPDVAGRVREVFSALGHPSEAFHYERTMGAEDVGVFMRDIPGMYFFLGSANEARGLNYPHHHPRFDFDEDALPLGVALLSAAVASYVIGS